MISKGIRGAITVDNNSKDAIKSATLELLSELVEKNSIKSENISHAIFTTTTDLDAEFPAKVARVDFGWSNVAMMCFHEMNVENSIKMCLRVMIVYNCDEQFIPKFVYLKGAQNLR